MDRKQIANFLARVVPVEENELRWSYVQNLLTKTFVEERSSFADDENWPYVFANEKEDDELEVQRFIIGFTTQFLLRRVQQQQTIYIDGTYRLMKDGFCLLAGV